MARVRAVGSDLPGPLDCIHVADVPADGNAGHDDERVVLCGLCGLSLRSLRLKTLLQGLQRNRKGRKEIRTT